MSNGVANTIYKQLGGRSFSLMTGAKNFVGGPNYLSFRLPGAGGFCKQGINCVKITLDPSDTYTVEFSRVRGGTIKPISKHDNIYFDQLCPLFRDQTGLETRFPTIRGIK